MKTNSISDGFKQPQQFSMQVQNQPSPFIIQQSYEDTLEDGYNDIQFQDLESTIAQLQRKSDNPSTNFRMSSDECSNQLQILLEKYQKIEKIVLNEEESIKQLINNHLELQQDLQTEYVSYQNVIAQGKHDIIQVSLVNKQALLYQTKGAKTVIGKQNEADNLSKEMIAMQSELQNINQRIREKVLLEKTLDEQNMKLTNTIEEFKNDQGEQKEGVQRFRQLIQQGENEIKQVKKEQLDMQRKLECQRNNRIEIKQKTVQFNKAKEVLIAELKNEKRMYQLSERKYQGLKLGLQSLEQEIERTNEQLQQIRQINGDTQKSVQLGQSTIIMGSQINRDKELKELRELERLLEDQNKEVLGNQELIRQKESEKDMLEGHLRQLNVFAQKYMERLEQESKEQRLLEQQKLLQLMEEQEDNIELQINREQEKQQQLNINGLQKQTQNRQYGVEVTQEDQEGSNIQNNVAAVVKDEKQDLIEENIHNIHIENTQNQGLELAQNQNELQKLDSSVLNINKINGEQSIKLNEPGVPYYSSGGHQISLRPQPLQDINLQSDKQSSNENCQVPQGKLEQQHETLNNIQSTIQDNLNSLQEKVDFRSDKKYLSDQKYTIEDELNTLGIAQEQHHIFQQTDQFGDHPNEIFVESPVKQQNYSSFIAITDNSELDSEQQQIPNEFNKGDIQVNSTIQLAEFIRQQEEKDKIEKNKNNYNDNQISTPSDSSKVLLHEHKRIMAQISVPGMRYQKIFSDIKKSMHKSDFFEQQQNGQKLQQNQQLNGQK